MLDLSKKNISRSAGLLALSTSCFFSKPATSSAAHLDPRPTDSPRTELLGAVGEAGSTSDKMTVATVGPFIGLSVVSVAGLVMLCSARQLQRYREMRRLAREGEEIAGEIVYSCDGSGMNEVDGLSWRFSAPNGKEYRGTCGLSSTENYYKYEAKQPVQVVYLPSNPKVSALKEHVALWADQKEAGDLA